MCAVRRDGYTLGMPEHDPSLRGPHPVGVIQTRISSAEDPIDPERTLPTEIWYPARPGVRERDDGEHPLGLPHRATRNVTPLPDATLPLVVFSHGNSGLRQQSTFLMTHLASHGFVVAAPDHVGNTFGEMISLETDEERREVHLRARRQRPHDVARVISALLDEGLEADRRPAIDPGRIGVAGHSYGGWTALKVAAHEPRVRSVCCLAPAAEPFVGRRADRPLLPRRARRRRRRGENERHRRMNGKTCIVTGGTSGIGEASALALAEKGANLAIVCRSEARGEATRARIEEATGRSCVQLFYADLQRLEDVRRVAAELDASLDRVDVLLNNAAVTML